MNRRREERSTRGLLATASSNELRDFSGSREWVFMLPDAEHFPPVQLQPHIGVTVSLLVCSQLLAPPCGVCDRPSRVERTDVPETAVHKHGDLGGYEGKISATSCAWQRPVDSKPMAKSMNGRSKSKLA